MTTEQKAAFTPGPWHVDFGYNDYIVIRSERHWWLARIEYDDHDVNTLANANLMAAAPDLYDVVKALADCFFVGEPDYERFGRHVCNYIIPAGHAAIKKARGEA